MSAAFARSAAPAEFHLGDQIFESGRLVGEVRRRARVARRAPVRPRSATAGAPRPARPAASCRRPAPPGAGRARRAAWRSTRAARRAGRCRRASASVSLFSASTVEPSKVAARIASAMSCGLTRIAGGGSRPMRCSTASTSAIDGAAVVERAAQRVGVGVEGGEALVGGGDFAVPPAAPWRWCRSAPH